MSRRTWVCAGAAAFGTTSQRSDAIVQRPSSALSIAEARLRSLRDRSHNYLDSSVNTLLPPYHNHVMRSNNSNQLRGSAANDSEQDRLGGYLISRAKKAPYGLPGAVFLRLEPQYTMSERVVSLKGYR